MEAPAVLIKRLIHSSVPMIYSSLSECVSFRFWSLPHTAAHVSNKSKHAVLLLSCPNNPLNVHHVGPHLIAHTDTAITCCVRAVAVLEFCIHTHRHEFISIIQWPVGRTIGLVLKEVQVPLSALIKPVHKTTDCFSCYVSLTSAPPTSMCPKQNRAFFMSQNWYKIQSIPPEEWKLGRGVTTSAKRGLEVCSWYGPIRATWWNEHCEMIPC